MLLLATLATTRMWAQEPEKLAAAGDFGAAANGFLRKAGDLDSKKRPLEAAVALSNAANCLKMTGDISAAALHLKQAVALLPADAPEKMRIAMTALAGSIGSLGKRPWDALPVLEKAEQQAFAAGLMQLHADVLNDLGIVHGALGDHGRAILNFERAIVAAGAGEDRALLLRATQNMVIAAFQRWKAAETDFIRAEELKSAEEKHFDAITLRDGGPQPETRAELATATIDLRRILGQADQSLKTEGPSALTAHLAITSGLANHRHGWKKAAFRQFSLAIDTARTLCNRSLECEAILGLAETYLDDGRAADSLTCLSRARTLDDSANPVRNARIELLSARAHAAISPHGRETWNAILRAVSAVEGVRSDIARSQAVSDLGSPFRERAGLPYLMLAELALGLSAENPAAAAEFSSLARAAIIPLQHSASGKNNAEHGALLARNAIELFKAWELQDYYRDDCVNVTLAKQRSLDELGEDTTAVLYVIPCSGKMEILLGTTTGLYRKTSSASGEAVLAAARRLRSRIQWNDGMFGFMDDAEFLHQAIIGPIRSLLRQHRIKHLVFVPDGALASIPLSALRDRTAARFLIEDFSVSIAPGLALVPSEEQKPGSSSCLLAGYTLASAGFPELPAARTELAALREIYPTHRSLIDTTFSRDTFRKEIVAPDVSLVHLATHGEFMGRADLTFLLCHDGRITLDDLEQMIRPKQFRGTPVSLLSLSACKTAAGDDRAALGLAGAAVKSGSRSVLATLWQVDDAATTDVMISFHTKLNRHIGKNKAAVLREAQLQLLRQGEPFAHPSLWAPFILIGDWK